MSIELDATRQELLECAIALAFTIEGEFANLLGRDAWRPSHGLVVRWRYVTRGRRFGLVNDPSTPPGRADWVFVRRGAFKDSLCSDKSEDERGCGDPQ